MNSHPTLNILQATLNWFWGFPMRVSDALDRALGGDPDGTVPPCPSWQARVDRRAENNRRFNEVYAEGEALIASMSRPIEMGSEREAVMLKSETQYQGGIAGAFERSDKIMAQWRRDCFELAGKLGVSFSVATRVDVAKQFFKWATSGVPNGEQQGHMDALAASINASEVATHTQAISDAEAILSFFNGD